MEAFFLIVIIVGVFIAIGRHWSKSTDDGWGRAAAMLRMTYTPGGWFSQRQIVGRYEGCNVIVETYTEQSGNNSRTYTRFKVGMPRHLGLGLRLTHQGWFSGVAKMFGSQDIEVGGTSFDANVIVKGADPERVRQIMTPEIRSRIGRLFDTHRGLKITDNHLLWERGGVVREALVIVNTVKTFSDVAAELTAQVFVGSELPRAVKKTSSGRRAKQKSKASKSRARDRGAQKVRGRLEASETALMAAFTERMKLEKGEEERGEKEEVSETPPPLPMADPFVREPDPAPDEPAPAEVETVEPAEQAEPEPLPVMPARISTTPIRLQESSAPPSPASLKPAWRTEESAGDHLDLAEIAATVFDPSRSTFDRMKMFGDDYKEKPVRGEGTIDSIETFSYDFALGNEPGTKVTLVGGEVQFVVALPPAAYEILKEKKGEPIAFRGRLVRMDTFPPRFYVTAAQQMV